MERYYMHKGRHVVVATAEESEGQVQVSWVGLNPAVTGTARRGRPPKYASPVPVSELEVASAEVVALVVNPATQVDVDQTLVNAEVPSTATEADSTN